MVHRAYGKEEVTEQFRCDFGLNPSYREFAAEGPLDIVELTGAVHVKFPG